MTEKRWGRKKWEMLWLILCGPLSSSVSLCLKNSLPRLDFRRKLNMTEEMQAMDAKSESRGWPGATLVIGLAAASALVLVLLFVVPGFVAAGFSRAGVSFVEVFPGDDWSISEPMIITIGGRPTRSAAVARVETLFARTVLYPAYQVMKRSVKAREFYEWQFQKAGGIAFGIFA